MRLLGKGAIITLPCTAFLLVLISVITGFVIGHFVVQRTICKEGDTRVNATQAQSAGEILNDSLSPLPRWIRSGGEVLDDYPSLLPRWIRSVQYRDMLVNLMDAQQLEDNLMYFTEKPHIAGSPRQKETADELAKRWKGYGFDKIEMPEYKVLLSFPQKHKPNSVTLYKGDTVIHQIKGTEKIAEPSEADPDVTSPFLGYAPSGRVETSELVFANYGRKEDFELLHYLNVDVANKIVIMKFGEIFRGDKVVNAARCGAVGALLYPDPAEFAQEGYDTKHTYPETSWLPGSAAPYGSIGNWPGSGDPLTPGLPSIDGMYRRPISDDFMPPIPAQSIGYDDAIHLLGNMGGNLVPEGWIGGLNITYTLGPMFIRDDMTIELVINNKLELKSIYNVIGTIYGKEEPDRYVIMGNHRDAWVFGAADPSSGTATMTEIARGLGKLLKRGWRPRRTIKICSWGGEEFALIGSVEWVEQHMKILSERAVVYLNFDTSVGGNYVMQSLASPLMKNDIWEQSKKIYDPNAHDDKVSMYDIMLERHPSTTDRGEPRIGSLGAGSDYASFYQYLGVPSAGFRYFSGYRNKSLWFPLYHTKHDTFNWMKNCVDPDFKFHKAMAQFGGSLLLHYSDSPLLSMNVSQYVDVLRRSIALLKSNENLKRRGDICLKVLEGAIEKFARASKQFEEVRWKVSKKITNHHMPSFAELRMLNNQMMRVERAFIHTYGLPERPLVRHVVFATSQYGGPPSFPGISDALYNVKETGDWEEVKRQISIAAQAVLSAVQLLTPYDMA